MHPTHHFDFFFVSHFITLLKKHIETVVVCSYRFWASRGHALLVGAPHMH